MKIYAKDGKEFDYEHINECLAYEESLIKKEKEEEAKRLKIKSEKDAEYREIIRLSEELFTKAKKYDQKYNDTLLASNLFVPFSPQLLPDGFKFRKLFL